MTTTTETVKNGAAKGGGRRNTIGGFLVARINGEVMRAFVEAEGLGIDTDVNDEQLAVAIALHFKNTVPPAELVQCDGCEGISSETLDACPFCGEGGPVEPSDDDTVQAAAESEGDVSLLEPEEDEVPAAPVSTVESESDEDESVVASPSPAPKSKAKKATKESKMETMTNGAAHGGAKKGLAKAGAATAIAAVRELDKIVNEVQKFKAGSAVAYWEMGRKVLEINERGLWKLRTDEGGKAKYKSFEQFVHHELMMSPTHAYNAMECARGYGSAEEMREIGSTSKAVLLLKAAPQDRKEIANKAKAGATKKEIAKDVAASRAKHGAPKADKQQAKAGQKGAAAKTAKQTAAALPEKVSVTSMVGSKTIKAYKRPTSSKGVDFAALPRAKKIADQPVGRLELAGGLVQYISLLANPETGELSFKIETRREG